VRTSLCRYRVSRSRLTDTRPWTTPRELRQCSKCGSWLPLEAFERGSCRDCVSQLRAAEREPDRKHCQANRSEKLKRKRAYYRKKPAVGRSFPEYKAKRRQWERRLRVANRSRRELAQSWATELRGSYAATSHRRPHGPNFLSSDRNRSCGEPTRPPLLAMSM
jgi:hypothetical protein